MKKSRRMNKPHRQRIDAVTRVLLREVFAGEHMSEMAVALRAADLGARAIRIGNVLHGTLDFLIKTRPTATGMKLAIRSVEFCIALPAEIGSSPEFALIFTRERRLGTPSKNDVCFFGGEGVVVHGHIILESRDAKFCVSTQ